MFEVKFSTDSEAYDTDNLRREIARKLTNLADYISSGGYNWKDGAIRDQHGIRVGTWKYSSKY